MRTKSLYPNLSSEMSRFNITPDDLATVLGVHSVNVRARLRGSSNLTFGDACKIRDYINEKYGTNYTVDYLFSTEPIAV